MTVKILFPPDNVLESDIGAITDIDCVSLVLKKEKRKKLKLKGKTLKVKKREKKKFEKKKKWLQRKED